MNNEKYIPALSYDWLTGLYDPVVALTTREGAFKNALVDQAGIADGHRTLDLGCGTATLSILLKQKQPNAVIVGIDGDAKILQIAKKKAHKAGVDITFDEGMSFDLPYEDESFDRIVSSLFFHHLSRESKSETLREVNRVLKPDGEFHVADWGLPTSRLMRGASYLIQFLDGFETTADNFNGLLPKLITDAGFTFVEETVHFNSVFGTIRLHKCLR
ncbi:MAG TPA: class I SAM-dependent methyltransferase [Pyrinomonadaceae bacterium]|nr:class I SAM-dependent methyltransferase [Chloracidobacterium sp.]MCC7307414.1 class I SAM-dependent methyltransferase [Acidobacteriota bacterium]HMT09930.1 class I SAM-dependent methyltransferase [Pyrinomonadaceae bacterium]